MIRLFNVFIPTSVVALIVSEFLIIFGCFFGAAYLVLDLEADMFLIDEGGWIRVLVLTAVIMLGFYLNDLYADIRVRSRFQLMQQLSLTLGVAFLFQAVVSYGRVTLVIPKWMMIYGSVAVLIILPLWRTLVDRLVVGTFGKERILFAGTSEVAQRLLRRIEEAPHLGIQPLGYLSELEHQDIELEKCRRVGDLSHLRDAVAKMQPDRVIVGVREDLTPIPLEELIDLRYHGVPVDSAATLYEVALGRVSIKELRPAELVFSRDLGPKPRAVALQSVYSFVLSLIGLIVLLPVMLIVALLVKMTSKGPVLFRQTRVGLRDQEFTLYKFRSMYADAEARTGAVWATKNDPRITPLGRYLRQLRLDELPQLINVLKGEMSICGPRPERPEFVGMLSEKIPFYRQRHCVKPGITGWAQINHKYGDTIEDTMTKLEYDLYYIKHLDPALDFYIMFQTAKVMLLSRGAQ
jgi:exopolysaccharide biosynthesis polyprenyl glycosylphosphotransferase